MDITDSIFVDMKNGRQYSAEKGKDFIFAKGSDKVERIELYSNAVVIKGEKFKKVIPFESLNFYEYEVE